MSIRTWLYYLIGDRQSILELAADRRTLWVGALFVLSAGLARDYDGEDLLHEPWHLLIPYAASLVTSLLLFSQTWLPAMLKRAPGPPLGQACRAFLGLFWMTAPLAWLYGIPYERFLGPLEATRANLITLAVVAAWRVALMVRVVSVLMGYRAIQAFFLVMLLADIEAFLALWFVPRPILQIMGGIHLTDSELLLALTGRIASAITVLSFPVWLIGAVVSLIYSKPAWQMEQQEPPSTSWGLPVVAMCSVLFWAAWLPVTQPEQLLRRQVEMVFREGRLADALNLMAAHQRSEFPPHWEPPPQIGWQAHRNRQPSLGAIWLAMGDVPISSWVRNVYREKLANALDRYLDEEDLDAFARAMIQRPEEGGFFAKMLEGARWGDELRRRIKEIEDGLPMNPAPGK